jgi:hypothetical protein
MEDPEVLRFFKRKKVEKSKWKYTESVDEYLKRGGKITKIDPPWREEENHYIRGKPKKLKGRIK